MTTFVRMCVVEEAVTLPFTAPVWPRDRHLELAPALSIDTGAPRS